jgi:DNA repair exonuclease SbcCD ATPase subunit
MQLIKIQDYRDCLASQRAAYAFHESKQQLFDKRTALKTPPPTDLDAQDIKVLEQAVANLEAGLKVKRAAVADLNSKIAEYEKSGLGSGVCPTCGTSVDNVVNLIAHLERERAPIIKAGQEEKATLLRTQEKLKTSSEIVQAWENYSNELNAIHSALEAYKDACFDQEAYDLCESVVNKYTGWEIKLADIMQTYSQAESEANAKKLELAQLVKYDKDPAEFTSEKIVVQEKINQLQKDRETCKKLEIEIAANNREIKSLKQELVDNKSYIDKNNKRKEYTSVLRSLYDLFHTGKFPRALIQTYSSTVTDYMNDVLASFDFPYTAKVNETFGIDIFNEEGLQLPAISGGQQVMVGFSLRLALHNMFVGAFPFMIIDEGSYGLNNENAKKYFEIIKSLGKTSKFKQVIVIDHHVELSDYVDNTISL